MPQIRGNVAYTGYSTVEPRVRNDAGMVGASDCRNRYSIWPGGGRGGNSGSGDITGHHMARAEETNRTCSEKWYHSDRTDAATTAGQCVNRRTVLNRMSATRGRVTNENTTCTGRGRSILRSI